jgi:NAD(P)-dependent dehydrogenase (short-subunit alcohol dehydrogenase family)
VQASNWSKARQLGALGAFVIVHGRNQERGEETVRMIRSTGAGDAVFYRADLGSLAGVEAFAAQALDRHQRLDLLINNAAAVAPIERAGSNRQRIVDGPNVDRFRGRHDGAQLQPRRCVSSQ